MKKQGAWDKFKGLFVDPDYKTYVEHEEYEEVVDEWDENPGITNIDDYRKKRETVNRNSDTISISSKRNVNFDALQENTVTPGSKIIKSEPKSIEQAAGIGDLVKQGKIVAIQMEGVETSECQRIMDFLGGVAYATGGQIDELSKRIFIIAPNGVEMDDHHVEQLKAHGVGLFGNFARKR